MSGHAMTTLTGAHRRKRSWTRSSAGSGRTSRLIPRIGPGRTGSRICRTRPPPCRSGCRSRWICRRPNRGGSTRWWSTRGDAASRTRGAVRRRFPWYSWTGASALRRQEITRPTHLGRPPNEMRDRLICAAIEAYMDPARGGESVSQSRACARVAEAVDLEENTVAKIWRRWRRGKQ